VILDRDSRFRVAAGFWGRDVENLVRSNGLRKTETCGRDNRADETIADYGRSRPGI